MKEEEREERRKERRDKEEDEGEKRENPMDGCNRISRLFFMHKLITIMY